MNVRNVVTCSFLLAACASEAYIEPPVDYGDEPHAETLKAFLPNSIPRVADPPPTSDLVNLPGDLRAVPVPEPVELAGFVKDREAAIRLGKALFWDMQVGSDGVQACASCHFRAGADPRSKNQLSPGSNALPEPDREFTTGGPNHQIDASLFPLTRLAVPGARGALDPATDNDDVVSSQGLHHPVRRQPDPDGFRVRRTNTRRVEARNAPSVFNAVFNHRSFWDGRADNVFNGVNHTGSRDPNARVARADDPNAPALVRVELENASLASQAVFPMSSSFEMAPAGATAQELAKSLLRQRRIFFDLARRLRKARPLAKQDVDETDSALGELSRAPHKGLSVDSYEDMIEAAFHPRWWKSNKLVQVAEDGTVRFVRRADNDCDTDELTLMEFNFALFFGLALQMYQATLVADDTPWDRFRRQHPSATDPALNPWTNAKPEHISRLALFGAHLFNDRTHGPNNVRCSTCHEQAELTSASVTRITSANEPVANRDGNIVDVGFANIGVRPTREDIGVGGADALGALSFSRRLLPGAPPAKLDDAPVTRGFGVEGAFKVPSLRNVALTAPYFHNGDVHTLRDAVLFYSRGGNVFPIAQTDGTTIEPLGVPSLTDDEVSAIVTFLEALTDPRVVAQRAPFDHPQIFVPNGHPGDEHLTTDLNLDGLADDVFLEVPAVGREGGLLPKGFLE
jgi:cytochrome c peroxidase